MEYLSEPQVDFLKDFVHHISGIHEFVDYTGRHHTMGGRRNGVTFNIFGDEWTFILIPDTWKSPIDPILERKSMLHVQISEDRISKPNKGYWNSLTIRIFPDIEEIAEFIYNYYFETCK